MLVGALRFPLPHSEITQVTLFMDELSLVARAGRERDMILEAFREQLISTRLAEQMLSDADRLIERNSRAS